MNILRKIRWALMIEIVLTQVMIAVIIEIFRKDKHERNQFNQQKTAKKLRNGYRKS
jgi:hypothetical protein